MKSYRNKTKSQREFVSLDVLLGNDYLVDTEVNHCIPFKLGKHYQKFKTSSKPLMLSHKLKVEVVVRHRPHNCRRWTYKTYKFTIPADYSWDGASTPKLFRPVVGGKLSPEFALASCLHDFAIERGLLPTFAESQMFYQCLKVQKGSYDVPSWKEKVMYLAVFSWSTWTDVKNIFTCKD